MDKSPATPDDYDLRTVMDDSESWTEGSTDLETALEPHMIEERGLARPPLPLRYRGAARLLVSAGVGAQNPSQIQKETRLASTWTRSWWQVIH